MTLPCVKPSLEVVENEEDSGDPYPPSKIDLRSPAHVRRELASLYRDARTGRLDASDATKLGYLLELLRKSFETTDLQERLECLERVTGGKK